MRAGEILRLRWEQIDWERGLLRLEPGTTKHGRGRVIPIVDVAGDILQRWREHTVRRYPSYPWMCHYEGQRIEQIQRRTWQKACHLVGLNGRLFHDLRRTAIRNMTRSGIVERVAMQISGHKTRSVFDRYDIVSEADVLDARQQLQGRQETAGMVTRSGSAEHNFEHSDRDHLDDSSLSM